MRRADAGKDLSGIRWDDKANYLLKLPQDNQFDYFDYFELKICRCEWYFTSRPHVVCSVRLKSSVGP